MIARAALRLGRFAAVAVLVGISLAAILGYIWLMILFGSIAGD